MTDWGHASHVPPMGGVTHGPQLGTKASSLNLHRLLKQLCLRALTRVAGVSRSWLQRFANEFYHQGTPRALGRVKSPASS